MQKLQLNTSILGKFTNEI